MTRVLELALAAQTDDAAIAVLHDALLEDGWHDDSVMMLLFGVELDPLPPKLHTAIQNAAWHRQRKDVIARPQAAAPLYAGKRRDWARAVLAVLLFESWPPRRKRAVTSYRTRSPWRAIVRQYQEREKANEKLMATYRELDRRAEMVAS